MVSLTSTNKNTEALEACVVQNEMPEGVGPNSVADSLFMYYLIEEFKVEVQRAKERKAQQSGENSDSSNNDNSNNNNTRNDSTNWSPKKKSDAVSNTKKKKIELRLFFSCHLRKSRELRGSSSCSQANKETNNKATKK